MHTGKNPNLILSPNASLQLTVSACIGAVLPACPLTT